MKKFKLGFTLAEVLITLGVIGVVAATVMPSVMTSYQYSTIGTKLSKFIQQTENSARSYAVMDTLSSSNFTTFVDESFIYSDSTNKILKDGTKATFTAGATGLTAALGHNADIQGVLIGNVVFNPQVKGLPAAAQNRNYTFVITELGYVFPSSADTCAQQIIQDAYRTTKKLYATGKCKAATT